VEKQGVIKPGLTPDELADPARLVVQKSAAAGQRESEKIAELDNDFRKRAAETIYSSRDGK
jgi:hypothetical protein